MHILPEICTILFYSRQASTYVLVNPASTFDWTDESDIAFKKMKELLTSPPVLAYPSEKGYFTLDTDASEVGLATVLSQRQLGPIESKSLLITVVR